MARFLTTNEMEFLQTFLTGDSCEDMSFYEVPEMPYSFDERVNDALMEVLGYGIEDMVGVDGEMDYALLLPPWVAMELPYDRPSRVEAFTMLERRHVEFEDMRCVPGDKYRQRFYPTFSFKRP